MIRRFVPIVFVMGFLAPAAAMAQSNFDGIWKIETNSMQFSTNPRVVLLQSGTFQCRKLCTAI